MVSKSSPIEKPEYTHIFTDGLDKVLSVSIWLSNYSPDTFVYFTNGKLKGYINSFYLDSFAREGESYLHQEKKVERLFAESERITKKIEIFHKNLIGLGEQNDYYNKMFAQAVLLLQTGYSLYFKTEEFYTSNLDADKDKNLIEKVGKYRLHFIETNIQATKDVYWIATHLGRKYGLTDLDIQFLTYQEAIALKTHRITASEIARRKEHFLIKNVHSQLEYSYGDYAKQLYETLIPVFTHTGNVLSGKGASVGVVSGNVYILSLAEPDIPKAIDAMPKGAVLVSESTQPDLVMACHKAAAIVTDEGGILSHAAIISRELHIPCVVGTKHATDILKNGQIVTVDGEKGTVVLSNLSVQHRTFISSHTNRFFMAMRHGQAIYSTKEDNGGDIVEGTLSGEGKKGVMTSAMEIVDVLKKQHIKGITIISSPKNRCVETARILSDYFSTNHIPTSTQIHEGLRDVKVIGPKGDRPNSYTRWEDHKLPGENWFDAWQRKAKEGLYFYPGEESPDDVRKRVSDTIQEIFSKKSTDPVLFMCHEEVLNVIAGLFDIPWHPPQYAEVWYVLSNEKP